MLSSILGLKKERDREAGTTVKCGSFHMAHFGMWVIRALSYLREREREREGPAHEMGWHFSALVPPVNPCAPEERSAMESCGGGEPWRHKAPL